MPENGPAVEISIGPGIDITFTFRHMSKPDIVNLLAAVMTPQEKTGALQRALNSGGEITMIMTTATK
jgi:hypothetical protein